MIIDFHSPCGEDVKTQIFGYGRAYYCILPELAEEVNRRGHRLANSYEGGDLQIFFGAPFDECEEYYIRKSERFWCYTMWESTIVGSEVLNNLKKFDGLIVPSNWCEKVFRESGYSGPIQIAPLGVAPGKWPTIDRDPERKPYRVYWQGTSLMDRKGAIDVIRALNDLNLSDSELWLKINPRYCEAKMPANFQFISPAAIENLLNHLNFYEKVNDIAVTIVGVELTIDEMRELLGHMDLSVYPSRGEGFGLLPLEHMQSGLPVIIADNSGMSMYIDPQYMIPLKCRERCSTLGPEFGIDYEADFEELKAAMLWAYEHRQAAHDMGMAAAEWVSKNWNYSQTARCLVDIAESSIKE